MPPGLAIGRPTTIVSASRIGCRLQRSWLMQVERSVQPLVCSAQGVAVSLHHRKKNASKRRVLGNPRIPPLIREMVVPQGTNTLYKVPCSRSPRGNESTATRGHTRATSSTPSLFASLTSRSIGEVNGVLIGARRIRVLGTRNSRWKDSCMRTGLLLGHAISCS